MLKVQLDMASSGTDSNKPSREIKEAFNWHDCVDFSGSPHELKKRFGKTH